MPESESKNDPSPPLFEVREVEAKGRGLVARCDITAGTRLISEKPFFTAPKTQSISSMESTIQPELARSPQIKQQLLALHSGFPEKKDHPLSEIFYTNCFDCDQGTLGVYNTICLLNHSCLPNVDYCWNSDTKSATIHATRPIKTGEELTVSYFAYAPDDYETRQKWLKKTFNFTCICELCSLPAPLLAASDSRRHQIRALYKGLRDNKRFKNEPDGCLRDCYSRLQLLREEYRESGGGIMVAQVYWCAFQVCILHGDQARAKVFAERAWEMGVRCEGEDNPATRMIRGSVENPAGHENFGVSRMWESGKGDVPRGLSEEEFEKWLWRQGAWSSVEIPGGSEEV